MTRYKLSQTFDNQTKSVNLLTAKSMLQCNEKLTMKLCFKYFHFILQTKLKAASMTMVAAVPALILNTVLL